MAHKRKTPPPRQQAEDVELEHSSGSVEIISPGRAAREATSTNKRCRRRYSGVEMWSKEEMMLREEECCILSCDPFAATEIAKFTPSGEEGVSVVAERGKVACRDYPHARHSCAKYPFSATSHSLFCDLCYCYVCDVAAPCESWSGTAGHCHAVDKDKKWRILRKHREEQAQQEDCT